MTLFQILHNCSAATTDVHELQEKLECVSSEYIVLAGADDIFPTEQVQAACLYAEKNHLDAVMLECSYSANVGGEQEKEDEDEESGGEEQDAKVASLTEQIVYLNRNDEMLWLPGDYDAVVYRRTTLMKNLPDIRHGYETSADLFFRIAEQRGEVGYLGGSCVTISHAKKQDHVLNPDNRNKDWYLDALEQHWKLTKQRYGENLPDYIQIHLLRELVIRIDTNRNRRNKHVLNEIEIEQFLALSGRILKGIRDEYLISGVKLWQKYNFSFALQEFLLHAKYENPDIRYILVNPEDDSSSTADSLSEWPVRIQINGRQLPNHILPKVYIDVMNNTSDALVLECASPHFLKDSDVRWAVEWNGESIHYEENYRYKDTRYFGLEPYHQYTFRVRIPKARFKNRNTLQFVLKVNNISIPHPMVTTRYPGRISTKLNRAYWCFDRYIATFNMGGNKTTLFVRKEPARRRFLYELLFLREIHSGRAARPDMIRKRIRYWLSYPRYHRKNIWLTFDKLYKGGDNGEYFYKYCMMRHDTDVVPVYVINEDAEDLQRIRREGYEPVIHGSRKHFCMFLHSKMVFATHAAMYKFNAIPEDEVPYLQDLLHADYVYISHGLSVQNLVEANNQAQNNTQLYYCASKYEVANLLQPAYGYQDTNIVRLKGLARFDGLVNDDQRQILITPTWRNYIALTPDNPNETRPYSSIFKDTDYYKIMNRLITDDKLLESAKENGYRIIYLVHPNIEAQAVDFEEREGVTVISALDANYEKLLRESSLMVTDYSGVQFDFAHMRKPIVYYHPPQLPPHYEDGGFFYDTQGFGEICTEHEALVNLLCAYMKEDCKLKDFYRARQDDYLEFSDHDSCHRIYDDAYEWQKVNRKK